MRHFIVIVRPDSCDSGQFQDRIHRKQINNIFCKRKSGNFQCWTLPALDVPLRSTRTADGRSVSAQWVHCFFFSARQRDPPLPGNGGLARRMTAPVQSRSRPDAAKAFATGSVSFKVNLIRYTADDGSRVEPQPILQVIVLDVITVTWMVLIASI